MIEKPADIIRVATSVRRFIPETIIISLDLNLEQLTSGNQEHVVNLSRVLSIFLGLYASIKDKVYLFFKKLKEQHNYSPLAHLEELLKGILTNIAYSEILGGDTSENLDILFESLIRFIFFDFRLFKVEHSKFDANVIGNLGPQARCECS